MRNTLYLLSFLASTFTLAAIKPGDSVLVPKPNEHYWYPAVVLSSQSDQCEVLYRDGGVRASFPAKQLRPMDVKIGTRVLGRWGRGAYYYPGTIIARNTELISIQYEDGDREDTTLSFIRVMDDNIKNVCVEGEPILSFVAGTGVWYAGYLNKIEKTLVDIQLSIGSSVRVGLDNIRPLKISVNDRVFARWQGGPVLYTGKAAKVEGDRVFIEYDDGDKEWTTSILVNVLAKGDDGIRPETHCTDPKDPHKARKIDLPKFELKKKENGTHVL